MALPAWTVPGTIGVLGTFQGRCSEAQHRLKPGPGPGTPVSKSKVITMYEDVYCSGRSVTGNIRRL